MPESLKIWEIRLGVYANEEQASELQEQVTRLLCPNPDHAPPCPIPWSVSLWADSELEDETREVHRGLIEQATIESRLRR